MYRISGGIYSEIVAIVSNRCATQCILDLCRSRVASEVQVSIVRSNNRCDCIKLVRERLYEVREVAAGIGRTVRAGKRTLASASHCVRKNGYYWSGAVVGGSDKVRVCSRNSRVAAEGYVGWSVDDRVDRIIYRNELSTSSNVVAGIGNSVFAG